MDKFFEDVLFRNTSAPLAYLRVNIGSGNDSGSFSFDKANAAFAAAFGMPAAGFAEKDFFELLGEDWENVSVLKESFLRTAAGLESSAKDIRNSRLDKWLRISGFPLDGDHIGCIAADVSGEYIRDAEIRILMEMVPDMLCITDKEGRILQANRQFAGVTGYDTDEQEGTGIFSLVCEEDPADIRSVTDSIRNGQEMSGCTCRCRCRDGSYRFLEWRFISAGKFIFASAKDTAKSIEAEEELRELAYYDKLTGLYNRHYFDRRIAEEMEKSERMHEPVSMISLDLDNFKNVNDTWGHQTGDEVLAQTALLLKGMIRKSDMAARLGGEEFAVVLPQTNRAEAEAAAEKIREKMNGTFHRTAGVVTASIGVAERAPSEPFESWYRRADEGVYAAKHRGRNQIVSVEYTHLQPEPVRHQVWQNAWNSGSELIDGEHLSLITLGNEILDMAYADAPFDVIMKQLDAIILHAGKHFSDEQRILEQIDYPDYRAHVRIHTVLIEKVAYLRDSFRDTRIKSPGFFSFIINDLIIGHLQEEDSKFYSYTRK